MTTAREQPETTQLPTAFGQELRRLRRERHLTQRALADAVGVNFTYICKIEKGREVPPGETTIRLLAEVLDTDTEPLLALAGKLPGGLKRRAATDLQFAMLLRKLPHLSEETLEDLYRIAGIPGDRAMSDDGGMAQ